MKVLVTGSKGFIGKNLCLWLENAGHDVLGFDIDKSIETLKTYVESADFIVHLAGVNRPLNEEEFIDGNVNFTKQLLDIVKDKKSSASIIFSSSVKAEEDSPYGRSKLQAEKLVEEFGKKNGNNVFIYRLNNVFGKWCRPNYNSVIATFCYNVAHEIELQINENALPIEFIYIDDICRQFLKTIKENPVEHASILYIEPKYKRSLKDIAYSLYSFKESRKNFMVPNIVDDFDKKLYSTYLSYLDEDDFSYPLTTHSDYRGSFTEILKTNGAGQFSVNISKPGIVKGNHYHNTKNEKYLVVAGTCEIKFRKIGTSKIFTYVCSDKELKVVDIPPGYTHSIKNIGKTDSVTFMWANELYDPDNSDTFYLPVEETK